VGSVTLSGPCLEENKKAYDLFQRALSECYDDIVRLKPNPHSFTLLPAKSNIR